MNSRTAWTTEQIAGQLGLHNKTLSKTERKEIQREFSQVVGDGMQCWRHAFLWLETLWQDARATHLDLRRTEGQKAETNKGAAP